MAFKRTVLNPKEIQARKLQAETGICWNEVAAYLDVKPSAVSNRLKRGTTGPIIEAFKALRKEARRAS